MLGSFLSASAVFVAFCSLIAFYTRHRQQAEVAGRDWFPEGSVQLGPAGMIMVTLLLSVVTIQWAVQATRAEDRPHQFVALGTTLMFGGAVLNQFWFVYQNTGFVASESRAALFFYVVTGSFIAMLIAAMATVLVITIRSLLGSFDSELAGIVQAGALLWHVAVICYALVWYVVFVTK